MKAFVLLIFFVALCEKFTAQKIDTKHIQLNLEFDWEKKSAFGTAEITFSPLSKTNDIYLDAKFLEIKKVSLKGKTLLFTCKSGHSDTNLHVFLDRKYKPNETLVLNIEYASLYENKADPYAIGGSFGKGLRFQMPTSTTPNKRRQIWSCGEPKSNSYWFPCNEELSDIHTMEVFARVEKPLHVVGNGQLIEIQDLGKKRIFHYRTDDALPNYLVAIVIGEFTCVSQKAGKTILHNFAYPDEKEAMQATVELLTDMLHFLEEKTGLSYPFESYSQVVVQDYPFPGLVGQHTFSVLSDNYVDDYGVHDDFKYLWDGVAMQALSNQWFGNLLMPKTWEDTWLNYSFAQYFAGLYTAKCHSKSEYLLWYFPFEKGNVDWDWQSSNVRSIIPQNVDDAHLYVGDNYAKFRGALVLRMLQHELGDELWWKVVQTFLKEHANQLVTTKDFQQTVEQLSGKSYQWFFDQWLYKVGLPQFEIEKKYDAAKKEFTVVVRQDKVEGLSAEWPLQIYFKGKISIEFNGKVETLSLEPKEVNVFVFGLEKEPEFLNFNYEQRFLSLTNFVQSKEAYLAQLRQSSDVLAKKEAMQQLVLVASDSLVSQEFKREIRNAMVEEVLSDAYWRYRMLALSSLSKMLASPIDEEMIALLMELIAKERSWLKSAAITILGNSKDPQFAKVYLNSLNDLSDRVINSAAIALGKTKSPLAFDALMLLENQKSWKNQNRISALNGLEQLGDDRAVPYVLACLSDQQSSRWYLATTTWDYPFAAVQTLQSLQKASLGFPILWERFVKSLEENDLNDIFQNVQLLNALKDERVQDIYPLLQEKFKNETVILEAVDFYKSQFLQGLNE